MHHPAEITYYDELGVEPGAGPEQIRDCFRSLVRILHPDHQTDPQLKEIAERQMRKLNRIYAVLSDPERRHRYDQSLENGFGPTIILSPNTSVNMRKLMGRLAFAGAAALLILITVFWLSSESPPSRPLQTEHSPPPSATAWRPAPGNPPQNPPDEAARLRAELRDVTTERDLAVREVIRLRGAQSKPLMAKMPEPVPASPAPLPATLTELPSPVLPYAGPANSAAGHFSAQKPSSPARPFAGFWFYRKEANPRAKPSTLYPPEFIEATINEQNGVIRGKYRSRYKVADRAISPDVVFEFAGTSNGSSVVAPWSGAGGARGEISLKIAGDNSMKVDWNTTQPGSLQGLISGTATLTRRLE